jgi:hypothetical protein
MCVCVYVHIYIHVEPKMSQDLRVSAFCISPVYNDCGRERKESLTIIYCKYAYVYVCMYTSTICPVCIHVGVHRV